jgi:HEAT repeat protein
MSVFEGRGIARSEMSAPTYTGHETVERRVPVSADLEQLVERALDIDYRYRLRPTRGFEYVNAAATRILGYTPEEHYADPDFGQKLVHPDALVRVHAALALWLIAEDRAGEKEAERALGNRMYQVRITAAEALWRIKQDARAVPLLVRVLVGSNLDGMEGDNERYMAVRALGRIGPPGKAAVEELKKLLTLSDPALAATAAGALKAIDGVRK